MKLFKPYRLLAIPAVAVAFVLLTAMQLPVLVASHFAADGTPDAFTSRASYVTVMASFAGVLPTILPLVLGLIRRVPPRFVNIPNRDYWLAPEHREDTFVFFERQGLRFAALTAVFLCFVHGVVLEANAVQPPRMSDVPLAIGTLIFLLLLALGILNFLLRFRRPTPV